MTTLGRRSGRGATVSCRGLAIAAAACAGCGSDGGSGPPPGAADPYPRPGDFDRSGCADAGFLGVGLVGLWSAGLSFPANPEIDVIMHRFAERQVPGFEEAPAQESGLRGWMGGWAIPRIIHDDGTLFWLREFGSEQARYTWAFLGCAAPQPDAFEGLVVACTPSGCRRGAFEARRIGWIRGEAEGAGLALVAEHPGRWPAGTTVNLRVAGGHAFLARYQDGLRILDVSQAASSGLVREVAHVPAAQADIWNDVKVLDGRWALVASSRRGLVVIDVGDPASPRVVVDSFPEMERNVHSIFLDAGPKTAYLADLTSSGIDIVDLADPTRPRLVGTFRPAGARYVHDLTVADGIGYLNAWNAGLVLVDLRDPAAPREIGRYAYDGATSHASARVTAGGRTFIVSGDEGWGAHVRIVDVDPASPGFLTEIGSFKTRDHVSVHNIECHGARCMVAYYQDGVRVLDVSDPTAPRQIAYFNTWQGTGGFRFWEGALGVHVLGGLVYVADSERDLLVLRETP